MLCYSHSFAQICLLDGTDSQVSDVAHRPLVMNAYGNELCLSFQARQTQNPR